MTKFRKFSKYGHPQNNDFLEINDQNVQNNFMLGLIYFVEYIVTIINLKKA